MTVGAVKSQLAVTRSVTRRCSVLAPAADGEFVDPAPVAPARAEPRVDSGTGFFCQGWEERLQMGV